MTVTGDVFDCKRFAVHDGPGIRTTVFLRGCPLSCPWCHNPEGLGAEEDDAWRGKGAVDRGLPADRNVIGPAVEIPVLLAELRKDEVFYRQSGGGVTISGGEPFAQPSFLLTLLRACGDAGLHRAVDTCGHAPRELVEEAMEIVDLFLYDLKLADDDLHLRYTGVTGELIRKNLARLAAAGAAVRVRVPLVPGITDTAANLAGVRRICRDAGVTAVGLLPYNKLGEDKRRRLGLAPETNGLDTQDGAVMGEIASAFRREGFTVTIGG